MSDFLQSLLSGTVTTALLLCVLWLIRNGILTRLKSSVQYEFDTKLEKVKADLRQRDTEFGHQLAQKSGETEVFRKSVLSAVDASNATGARRRLEAVDQMWENILDMEWSRPYTQYAQAIKLDAFLSAAVTDKKIQEVAAFLVGERNIATLNNKKAALARPHLTEMAWALFLAHYSISYLSVLYFTLASKGIDSDKVIKTDSVIAATKLALPEKAAYLDRVGLTGCFYLVEDLERAILTELRAILAGKESDGIALERAEKVIHEFNTADLSNPLKIDPKYTEMRSATGISRPE